MKIKCLKPHCKNQIELTDNEIESYNNLLRSGFILSKHCVKHGIEFRLSYDMAYKIIDELKLKNELKKSIYDPVSFLFKRWMNENYGIDKIDKFKSDVKEQLEMELNKIE